MSNHHMKTVAKSTTIQQPPLSEHQTAMQNKKCKSLVLPNQVFMKKGREMVGFPVFRDSEVGIDSVHGKAIMHINADEDVESTKSIVDYGTKLCYLDLKDFLDRN